MHARQAFVFGIVALVGYALVLALPLAITTVIPAVSTGATIAVYGVGLVVDVVALVVLFGLAVRYYALARRGSLFAIPLVTTIVDRFFRVRGVH